MKVKAISIVCIAVLCALGVIAWGVSRPAFVRAADLQLVSQSIQPTTVAYAVTLRSPARRADGLRAQMGPGDLARLKEVFHRPLIVTEWWSLQVLSEEASHVIVLEPRGVEPVYVWVAIESRKIAINNGPFRGMPSWLARDIKEFLLELGLPMNLRVFDASAKRSNG